MEVEREVTRIYVGGLGSGVTEDDLRKTFSALGEVVSVDVVRTKGRSFAYLDFLPSSDKSLPKLFSTYNGCMWKGGKLRLEKAKEHYLVKLKREWEEDSKSKLASKPSDLLESHDVLEKTKKPSSEINKHLCLFFPKLGKAPFDKHFGMYWTETKIDVNETKVADIVSPKRRTMWGQGLLSRSLVCAKDVKSLGQVGIGKHKYSFQRIQVPPIPTHFCDCEEHSLAFLPTIKNQVSEFENASNGINEQELNIMNSVMNKIFERANPSKQVIDQSKPVKGGQFEDSNDELDAIENSEEDHLTDEDNLIINVGNRSDSVDLLAEMRMMANRDVAANMHDVRKKKRMRANRVSIHNHKSELANAESTAIGNGDEDHVTDEEDNLIINLANGSDSVDLLAEMRMMADQNAVVAKMHEGQEKKAMSPVEKRKSPHSNGKTVIPESSRKARNIEVVESDAKQSGSKSLRSLKSTWKDLIGQKHNTPLTISNIAPTVHQEKQDEFKADYHLDNKKNESVIHPSDSDHKEDQTEASPEKHAGDMIPAARGGSWRQKSSWTQLVSTASHGSFSISQIVPDLSYETEIHGPVNNPSANWVVTESTGRKKLSSERKRSSVIGNLDSENTCSFMRTETSASHGSFSISQIVPDLSYKTEIHEPVNNPSASRVVTESTGRKKLSSERKRSSVIGNLDSENTCSFMRTETSVN